jgi:hypothetical protein
VANLAAAGDSVGVSRGQLAVGLGVAPSFLLFSPFYIGALAACCSALQSHLLSGLIINSQKTLSYLLKTSWPPSLFLAGSVPTLGLTHRLSPVLPRPTSQQGCAR